jgi:hypothetical protein
MRRTLKDILFASQLCGILLYGSFLRNDGYEKPVICRKYLLYSFILIVTISVVQLRFVIGSFRGATNVSSAAVRSSFRIPLILVSCIFTAYLCSSITRLIGQRNFFKISRKNSLMSIIICASFFVLGTDSVQPLNVSTSVANPNNI